MRPTVLVVTTVHWPDDTRIRERLIRSLSGAFEVEYASREPGPSDNSGLHWISLSGPRARRWFQALAVCMRRGWDVLVIHDPELIPIGVISRLAKRRPVVLDVHEDFPATAMTRDWVPEAMRKPLAFVARWVLRAAEMVMDVTLAEDGYRHLFRNEHPVFPNYPDTSHYPAPTHGESSILYLGDVTVERGAMTAAKASRELGLPLVFVGRVSEALRSRLEDVDGGRIHFVGRVSNPKALDLARREGVGISPLHDSPNYRHSAPTKILEYLALGLPVVASDLPGTRQLVDGLDAVELVAPGDADELAHAIERSLNPETRKRAVAQVPQVRKRFSWPGDDVVRFYSSLV